MFDSDFRYLYLGGKGQLSHISDEEFIKKAYLINTGRCLDLYNPVSYTEKLQWLKLYDHNPRYTAMVDKYAAKEIVASIIGAQYVIPTLGLWSSADDIDFEVLPNSFVLKCTHDSGSTILCKDKNNANLPKMRKKLKKYIKRNYYHCSREWPYKNVLPQIIAEPYMEDSEDRELRDYKFFTFNGEPRILYITQGRGNKEETVADFYDMEFNHLNIEVDHKMSKNPPHPPQNFNLMKKLAKELSKGTPQLRVDFYEVNGKVYFGEMTFFHCSGFNLFKPIEWENKLGEWVKLPEKI